MPTRCADAWAPAGRTSDSLVKGYPLWHFAYASSPRIVMDYANDGLGATTSTGCLPMKPATSFLALDESRRRLLHLHQHPRIYKEPNANCAMSFGLLWK